MCDFDYHDLHLKSTIKKKISFVSVSGGSGSKIRISFARKGKDYIENKSSPILPAWCSSYSETDSENEVSFSLSTRSSGTNNRVLCKQLFVTN
jgi:hypothetical protein